MPEIYSVAGQRGLNHRAPIAKTNLICKGFRQFQSLKVCKNRTYSTFFLQKVLFCALLGALAGIGGNPTSCADSFCFWDLGDLGSVPRTDIPKILHVIMRFLRDGDKLQSRHFYISHRPPSLLRVDALSRSWEWSILGRFSVDFCHFQLTLTKN